MIHCEKIIILLIVLRIQPYIADEKQFTNECPQEDNIDYTVHTRHENDCSKFYTCYRGSKILSQCPEGLYFNPYLEVCDNVQILNCSQTGSNQNSDKNSPDGGEEKDDYNSEYQSNEQNQNDSNENNRCPPNDDTDNVVQFPHESNCSLFYKCSYGKKTLQECPDNLLYNTVLQVCDWPDNVQCSQTNGKNSKKVMNIQCPETNEGSDTVHLPHETNCSLYYKCDNGRLQLSECPGILQFNPTLHVCDWPSNVNCINKPPVPQMLCPQTKCQDTTTYLPSLANPRQFIKCVNGEEVIGNCPNGLVFDTKLRVCNLEHLAE